jgi:hypothetical protein
VFKSSNFISYHRGPYNLLNVTPCLYQVLFTTTMPASVNLTRLSASSSTILNETHAAGTPQNWTLHGVKADNFVSDLQRDDISGLISQIT